MPVVGTYSMNPDLVRERQNCTFRTSELTVYLDGGEEKTADRKSRESFFLDDPELKYQTPPDYLSHKEKYEEAIKKSCVIFRKVRELQAQGKGSVDSFRQILGGQLGTAVFKDGNPLALHYVMFIPTLMGQGTIEQQAYWINRAWNLEIIGTYAQTELGHGTFIRGLETTATYDPLKEEFILHSPTLTSYKWWPGGLGHSANYAIVLAQLYTKGQCHGIHPFIVQLRDEDTHRPLQGIKIGEIGHKLGMNATNNGFLGFEQVRIPRENMLMKNNQVLQDGTYVKAPSSKLTYGTMIFVRVVIVQDAANYLKKACTIATRYSAVRHQSQIKEGEPEPQIIDYVTQQNKLFPNIATYFAYQITSTWLWDLYNNVSSELESGQLDRLGELHAIACCLKATASADAATGIEQLRLSCGGHGYMTSSNLPTTYGLVTAMCTYEGENTVLLLQTGRYLSKSRQSVRAGTPATPTLRYLERHNRHGDYSRPFVRSVQWLLEILENVGASKIELACDRLDERVRRGTSPEDAWNETSLEMCAAAEAHCRVVVVSTFASTMKEAHFSPELALVIDQLVQLYAVVTVMKYTGDMLRFTKAVGADVDRLQVWCEELLALIRPNAVGIVDSFDLRDEVLSSTLGSYDGHVYQRLFDEAMKSPLNQLDVNCSFESHLKPFLKSNL